jgi:pyridoxal 5'-phosphate synthase pdxS subunit
MSELNENKNVAATSLRLKVGLAEMLKGGVIMDVMNVEQARIAEESGATSVMALERVPAMIRAEGGVARMARPSLIKQIIQAVSIPVMAKARIGHFAEAQILQELGVDFIDESEVLTPADEAHHIDKHAFTTPFVCGARNLGEALRRIAEGAAMIRTKGEAGTGDVVFAVRHMRQIIREMRALTVLSEQELYAAAKEHQAPYELIRMVAQTGKLPVPNFSAGGIATPADAALMMQLGAEAIFVGSGIFMKERATPLDVENDPKERQGHRHRHHPLQRPQNSRRGRRAGHWNHEGPRRRRPRREGPAPNPRLVTTCGGANCSRFARKNSSLSMGAVFASAARPALRPMSASLCFERARLQSCRTAINKFPGFSPGGLHFAQFSDIRRFRSARSGPTFALEKSARMGRWLAV